MKMKEARASVCLMMNSVLLLDSYHKNSSVDDVPVDIKVTPFESFINKCV